jgi:integrase
MGKRGNGEGSIYQRAIKRTLKDGTVKSTAVWCAAVSLETGRRKILYGKTRGEVAKKLNAAIDRKSKGIPFVNERLTVGAWLDHWLGECIRPRYDAATGQQVAGREPTTYASYEILVRRHIKPYLGHIRLAKLQTEDVDKWQDQPEQSGASAETRRAALVRLRTAINVAIERDHLTRNVAEKTHTPRQPRKTYEMPLVQDLRGLLNMVQGDPLEALVYLALGLGLRRAEVIGLHWEDVDFDNRIITVRTRVNRLGKGVGLLVRARRRNPNGASSCRA